MGCSVANGWSGVSVRITYREWAFDCASGGAARINPRPTVTAVVIVTAVVTVATVPARDLIPFAAGRCARISVGRASFRDGQFPCSETSPLAILRLFATGRVFRHDDYAKPQTGLWDAAAPGSCSQMRVALFTNRGYWFPNDSAVCMSMRLL